MNIPSRSTILVCVSSSDAEAVHAAHRDQMEDGNGLHPAENNGQLLMIYYTDPYWPRRVAMWALAEGYAFKECAQETVNDVHKTMTYVEVARDALREAIDVSEETSEISEELLDLYVLLLLRQNEDVTSTDVHDAWSIWMKNIDPHHRLLVPFAQMKKIDQDVNRPYVNAVMSASQLLKNWKTTLPSLQGDNFTSNRSEQKSYAQTAKDVLTAKLKSVSPRTVEHPALVNLYLTLLLTKGPDVTKSDVHAVQAVNMLSERLGRHPLVPYEELEPNEKAKYEKFVLAIVRAHEELSVSQLDHQEENDD